MSKGTALLVDATVWVACNVYVSSSQATRLMPLLRHAQQECSKYCSTASSDFPSSSVVLVHAFGDVVYNRSSFHFAGTALGVSQVASQLAIQALHQLAKTSEEDDDDTTRNTESGSSDHPFVGMVDHISVMPLTRLDFVSTARLPCTSTEDEITSDSFTAPQTDDARFEPSTPSGWAARQIGEAIHQTISNNQLCIHYYGAATPDNRSLAQVRRESTSFFQSGGLDNMKEEGNEERLRTPSTSLPPTEISLIGAPPEFVENYNMQCRGSLASVRALTRHIRARDGGLPGVEALTLPYHTKTTTGTRQQETDDSKNSQTQEMLLYEVACNLLQPNVSSAKDIEERALAWILHRKEQQPTASTVTWERGYRVGTTAGQCCDLLKHLEDGTIDRNEHDQQVEQRMLEYLQK